MSGMNAYEFKRQYIDSQEDHTFFKIMTRELNYYFFSHTHDVAVELYTKTDIVGHFFDFFNYLTRNYNGIDVSRAYSAYYQELSKKQTDVQKYVWSTFYTFSILMETSAELRAIRYSVEKSKELDLIIFFQHIKNMIATVLSINFEILIMDNLNISPVDLSQVFSAIYGKRLIKKMHLLNRVSNRSNKKGIIASELAVVIISDFVKERQKKDDLANKPRINFAEFYPVELDSKNNSKREDRIQLKFEEKDDQFVRNDASLSPGRIQTEISSKKKKRNRKKLHKELLVDTRKDLLNQMNYIIKEKVKTEERIINGTTLLRKSLVEYNKLLEFIKELQEAYFNVYFKIKMDDPTKQLPVDLEEVRTFRSIEELLVKSLIKEISDVGETELLLESLHQEKNREEIEEGGQ